MTNARRCGPCNACCTILHVEEIAKPAGKTCEKLCEGRCGIYETRPRSCADFGCVWLTSGEQSAARLAAGMGDLLRNMDRPNTSGVMLDTTDPDANIGSDVFVAYETRPGAFREDAAMDLLQRVSRRNLVILMRDGEGRQLIGPEHLVKKAQAGGSSTTGEARR